jgi:hypothetical protein
MRGGATDLASKAGHCGGPYDQRDRLGETLRGNRPGAPRRRPRRRSPRGRAVRGGTSASGAARGVHRGRRYRRSTAHGPRRRPDADSRCTGRSWLPGSTRRVGRDLAGRRRRGPSGGSRRSPRSRSSAGRRWGRGRGRRRRGGRGLPFWFGGTPRTGGHLGPRRRHDVGRRGDPDPARRPWQRHGGSSQDVLSRAGAHAHARSLKLSIGRGAGKRPEPDASPGVGRRDAGGSAAWRRCTHDAVDTPDAEADDEPLVLHHLLEEPGLVLLAHQRRRQLQQLPARSVARGGGGV